MKLHLANPAGEKLFTGYGDGYVAINYERYSHNVLLASGHDVAQWSAANFESLGASDFEALLALKPEIVILGTGATLRFPKPDITRPLAMAHIGIEVMDTKAACRTYNILVAEGRQVVAAIF